MCGAHDPGEAAVTFSNELGNEKKKKIEDRGGLQVVFNGNCNEHLNGQICNEKKAAHSRTLTEGGIYDGFSTVVDRRFFLVHVHTCRGAATVAPFRIQYLKLSKSLKQRSRTPPLQTL